MKPSFQWTSDTMAILLTTTCIELCKKTPQYCRGHYWQYVGLPLSSLAFDWLQSSILATPALHWTFHTSTPLAVSRRSPTLRRRLLLVFSMLWVPTRGEILGVLHNQPWGSSRELPRGEGPRKGQRGPRLLLQMSFNGQVRRTVRHRTSHLTFHMKSLIPWGI